MSSVVSFGTNTNAQRKRVYYTETTTVLEGMPVCYEFDATTNVLGYDKGAGGDPGCQTSPTTTAEGYQNEGKFLRVEDPDADNIHAFAGVVATGPKVGSAGPCWLDIFIPNGAIVPVRSDQNCTVGKTILAVHTGETHLTAPFEVAGRAVAVAWETKDTATTTGIVLAKLSDTMFIYQKGDAVRLEVDDEDAGNIMINQIIVGTSQASGLFSALQIKSYQSAGNAESWDYGLALNVSADLAGGTVTAGVTGSGHWLNIGAVTITVGHIHALRAGIYEGGAATWTSPSGITSCINMTLQIAGNPGNNQLFYFNVRNDGAHAVDGLFHAYNAAAIGLTANTDTVDFAIPIRVGGTTYYLAVTSATS
jgi:hypothetical protein